MHWLKISLLLCTFGFLKEFRPSESFVTPYLEGPWKNFTSTEINQEIFPISTYSTLSTLVLIFLITDLSRYKPIIILCSLSGLSAFVILTWGKNITAMQFVEFFYGLFFSSEVAYYTYIYAKVDKKHYEEVTGHTKAAILVGRFMAGLVAQLTTSFELLDYHQLNFLTISALLFATLWALFLPPVAQSIYFHSTKDMKEEGITDFIPTNSVASLNNLNAEQTENQSQKYLQLSNSTGCCSTSKFRMAYFLLWKDFLAAYSNSHVVKWSIWWAFSTAGYLQVISYIQLLWTSVLQEEQKMYNGAVDAIYTIISAVAVFVIGKIPVNWPLLGEATLCFCSILEGVLLITASKSTSIWVLYIVYMVYGIIYHTMVTVASFEVAKHISDDSYGLIFGINNLIALSLQSILTAIVVSGPLELDIGSQYFIYGGCYIVLGILFMLMAIFTIIRYSKSGNHFKLCITDAGSSNEV